MNFVRRVRDVGLSLALLAIPFFFLESSLKNPSRTSMTDRLLLRLSAPIQYVATRAARGVSGTLERYVYLVDAKRNNESLLAEVAELRSQNRALALEATENRRLRELLGFRRRLRGEALSAEIVGNEMLAFFRVVRIRIDRGESDLVRPGMPVVAPAGLVGQVRRVSGAYSDVLLTVDRTSAIDVVVLRSGARGMLRGTGESTRYRCHIEYLQRSDDVRVGDEVYTSGLGQRFPPALFVGRVTRVSKQGFGLYQDVDVEPAVDFSALQEVLVLTSGPKDQPGGDRSTRGGGLKSSVVGSRGLTLGRDPRR